MGNKQETKSFRECHYERRWCDVWNWSELDDYRVSTGNFGYLVCILGKALFEKLKRHPERLELSLE